MHAPELITPSVNSPAVQPYPVTAPIPVTTTDGLHAISGWFEDAAAGVTW
jgi:hypothetical protein